MRAQGLQEARAKLIDRVTTTWELLGDAWPYYADSGTGRWETVADGDWAAGHWIECLRIAAEVLGRPEMLADAQQRMWQAVAPRRTVNDTFRGHMFYYATARLAETTGDPALRDLAIEVAYRLSETAMAGTGLMPLGTELRVAGTGDYAQLIATAGDRIAMIDSVHANCQIIWYGWRQTQDANLLATLRRHLDRLAEDFIREDGSTVELIEYDPETGRRVRHFTVLGTNDDSCWSRGQAWAIAGYLRAYEELGECVYLEVAEKLMRYWVEHCTGGLIPPWDFDGAPNEGPRDTSAAAIVAEGLARIAVRPDRSTEAARLLAILDPLLIDLMREITPLDATDSRPPGMLLNGCFHFPKRLAYSNELIWGDFYLLCALHCLCERGLPC